MRWRPASWLACVALTIVAAGCARDRRALEREPPALSAEPPATTVRAEPWRPDPSRGPAADPLPMPPPLEAPDPTALAPRSRPIGRDALHSDRFHRAGQSVRYPFVAEAGELALFELWTYGFARGWVARAHVAVEADGRVLVEQGGVCAPTGRVFVPFVAPRTGSFTLVVTAEAETFRYHVVRHSSYRPDRGPLVLERHRRRGWLADEDAEVRLALALARGEGALVRITSTRAADRRAEQPLPAPRARERSSGEPSEREARGDPVLTPTFGLVTGGGPPRRLVWLRAGEAREVELGVRVAAGALGGFFDVRVERDPSVVTVTGVVVDRDDQLLSGARLAFALEPERTVLANVRTADDGRYRVELPTGPYRIAYGLGEGREIARTPVDADREINLIWPFGP